MASCAGRRGPSAVQHRSERPPGHPGGLPGVGYAGAGRPPVQLGAGQLSRSQDAPDDRQPQAPAA
eukprot:scaffold671333_cov45-Prasinocladus_malaysianus.AAC.1